MFIVGWKPILYWLFVPKNQYFRNKYGRTHPIQTKFGIRGHVNGWQRLRNFWRDRPILGKMGAQTSPAEPEFFWFRKPRDLSATSQRAMFTKFGHKTYRCSVNESGKTFSNIFTLGVISRQNPKSRIGQTGTSLRAGYTTDQYCHHGSWLSRGDWGN